ncbi:MAG TPA: tRNA pseudouridine(55) synthase TruB [Vicinamibacterales bacterium]|jgi:tRNA pseudouridine55 synthase
MDGLLVLDKPKGPTSHDVVARMRRVLRERRIGHTGTLDPAATGILVLVVGRATRLAQFLSASDKTYEAVVALGVRTDSADADGEPLEAPYAGPMPSRDAIADALASFQGRVLQQPPAFSAKKIDGRRSYAVARAARHGRAEPAAPPAAVPVTLHAVHLVSVADNMVTLTLDCSAGFYVRALARDLGDRLGTGGHLAALRRTRVGAIALDQAIGLDAAERDPAAALSAVVPLGRALPHLPHVTLSSEGVRKTVHGREVNLSDASAGGSWPARDAAHVCLLDADGELVAIAVPGSAPGLLHPSVVLR